MQLLLLSDGTDQFMNINNLMRKYNFCFAPFQAKSLTIHHDERAQYDIDTGNAYKIEYVGPEWQQEKITR